MPVSVQVPDSHRSSTVQTLKSSHEVPSARSQLREVAGGPDYFSQQVLQHGPGRLVLRKRAMVSSGNFGKTKT